MILTAVNTFSLRKVALISLRGRGDTHLEELQTTTKKNLGKDNLSITEQTARGSIIDVAYLGAFHILSLTPSLPRCRLKTSNKRAKFETLKTFCLLFCIGR